MPIALTLLSLLAVAAPAAPAAAEEPVRDPGALTILAEISLERGECKEAAEYYLAALPNGDAGLAERSSEVALACEHMPAAWESVQRWRNLAADDPDAAAVYAAVALRLYHIPEAQAAVRTVLGSADSDPRLAELAVLLLDQAEVPAVLAVIGGAVKTDAASAPVLTLLAELALNAQDLRRAQRYAELALRRKPDLFEARSLMAQIHARQGDGLNALAAAQAAREIDEKRGAFEVAQTLIALDRMADAREELERLRAAGGSATEIDRRLALLALQDGNLEDARRRFDAMSGMPSSAETAAFYLAEIAALEGDSAQALAGYRRLLDSSVGLTARTRAAALMLEAGQREEALALMDEYVTQHPESSFDLTMTKAHLLSEHGQPEAGLALLATALEQHPQHPALQYDRAVLLESAGKLHEAIDALEQLLEKRPGDPTLLNALGYTLADHGIRLAHAESLIRRALADTPDNPAVIDSLGWVRFRRGDARGAAPILEHAFAISHDAEIAAHWGEALWKAGEKQRARKVWTDALALDPDSKALQTVIGRFAPPGKS